MSIYDYIKDFGITGGKDLTYHKHIESINTAVTSSKLYIIKICFHSKSILLLKKVFPVFIRQTLE